MKTYEQLTPLDQKLALNYFQVEILTAIAEGKMRFDDELNGNDVQAQIDALHKEYADKHPWEFAQKLAENDIIVRVAVAMAKPHAEMAIYMEEGENAIDLEAVRDMGQPHIHHANCNHKTSH